MRFFKFKILTLLCLTGIFYSVSAYSDNLAQELFKTHLRWRINTPKDQISIRKEGNTVFLETLNEDFYSQIVSDLTKLEAQKAYFTKFSYSKEGYPEKPASIVIELKDNSVELFSFYKDNDQSYLMDFWINQDIVKSNAAAVVKTPKVEKTEPAKKRTIPKAKKLEEHLKKETGEFNFIDPESVVKNEQSEQLRDFRYGAAFLDNRPAFIPPVEKDIKLEAKAPDYLYQIKDRELSGDPKEAHMQLSINFFRQKKWGLMTKSIGLYETKYGSDKNKVFNDYLKATALIKNTIKETIKPEAKFDEDDKEITFSDKGTVAAGINLLTSVVEATEDYDLKQAILRYLLQVNLDKEDYVRSLQSAKRLYVAATENFDDQMIIYSSKIILFSLANLKQLEKITEFLSNKAVLRVLPQQEGLAYQSYVNLMNDNTKEIIKAYEANKQAFTQPVHPAIIYNTAEAYFRNADYEKALKLYDYFLASYPGLTPASRVRLSLAVAYDLLDRPRDQLLKLYQDAINRSSDPYITYEAKLRYVGLRIARNKKPTESDLETVAFLEKTPAEKAVMDNFLKKLLWQVRLRYFIVKKEFNNALAYLNSMPLDTLHQLDRRVFEGDGAEIVVGLIKDSYQQEQYSAAVKIWEVYKDKYEKEVAKSAYLAFIVSDSFLKLGLNDSFERSFDSLKKASQTKLRTFPSWVEPHKSLDVSNYIAELELLKSVYKKDWVEVGKLLGKVDKDNQKKINYEYYMGLVNFNQKKYNEAITGFEKIIAGPNKNNQLSQVQNANMLTSYIEALYQVGDSKRFQKNALALIQDIEQSKTNKFFEVNERIHYLVVEDIFAGKGDYKKLEKMCRRFLTHFDKSEYMDRVNYIYGHSLVRLKKNQDGKEVLKKLIEKQDAAEYLKGLARSELSSLEIKEKTL